MSETKEAILARMRALTSAYPQYRGAFEDGDWKSGVLLRGWRSKSQRFKRGTLVAFKPTTLDGEPYATFLTITSECGSLTLIENIEEVSR